MLCSVQCVGGCHWGGSDGQILVPGCRAAQCWIVQEQSEPWSFWTKGRFLYETIGTDILQKNVINRLSSLVFLRCAKTR